MKKLFLFGFALLALFAGYLGGQVADKFPSEAHASQADILALSEAFENVANKIKPSVVSIKAVQSAKKISPRAKSKRSIPRHPLERFFGPDMFGAPGAPNQRDFGREGLGSGVIIRDDGYIVTNSHVVADADEVTITLHNGKKMDAEVIGTDPQTDIAVIKVDGKDLTSADLGDSDKLKVGQWVVAAGSPFNLSQTITAGIVSAVGRSNVGIAAYEDFIQTDAAINPGNSGGPLVNLRGEVIGINTAIFSRSGGYMGIGFAIPATMVRTIMDRLISDGFVERGYLGIMIQPLDEDFSRSFSFVGTDGALVGQVAKDGPAGTAGVQQGDIVVSIDGESVKDPTELKHVVADKKPGSKVELKVYRDGAYRMLKVKLGKLESEQPGVSTEDSSDEIGLSYDTLTPEIAARYGIDADAGVIVLNVDPSSAAARAGLRAGDVISKIDGVLVSDRSGFREALREADLEAGVRLSVRRGSGQFFAFIKD